MKLNENKYKAIAYQTSLGIIITELIKRNFDDLVTAIMEHNNVMDLSNKFSRQDAANVAQTVLVDFLWGATLGDWDNMVLQPEGKTYGDRDDYILVDMWLETLLKKEATKI